MQRENKDLIAKVLNIINISKKIKTVYISLKTCFIYFATTSNLKNKFGRISHWSEISQVNKPNKSGNLESLKKNHRSFKTL